MGPDFQSWENYLWFRKYFRGFSSAQEADAYSVNLWVLLNLILLIVLPVPLFSYSFVTCPFLSLLKIIESKNFIFSCKPQLQCSILLRGV